MSSTPTHKQIHDVQKVLYKHAHLDSLARLAFNIQNLMNLNPNAPQASSGRPSGSGPDWYIPATGKIDTGVLEAAADCDQLAKVLREMKHELQHVDFPDADKHHLMTALEEEAASWTACASAWRQQAPPTDPKSVADGIAKHTAAALQAAKHVRHYLKPRTEVCAQQKAVNGYC